MPGLWEGCNLGGNCNHRAGRQCLQGIGGGSLWVDAVVGVPTFGAVAQGHGGRNPLAVAATSRGWQRTSWGGGNWKSSEGKVQKGCYVLLLSNPSKTGPISSPRD